MPIMYRRGRFLIVAIGMVVLLPVAGRAQSVDAVRGAYADVDRILTGGQSDRDWREYLLLDQLSGQMQKNMAADRAVVARIYTRFVKASAIIRQPAYTAVRDALEAWLQALDAPKIGQLSGMARKSTENFQRFSAADLRTQRAIAKRLVDSLPLRIPSPAANEGWRRYLEIPQASEQLSEGASIDTPLLELIALRHTAIAPIVKDRKFTSSATALRKTSEIFRSMEVNDEEYRSQIERLAVALDSYAHQAQPADVRTIVEILSWLDERGQAAALVEAVRPHFHRPNLYVRASGQLAGVGFDDSINEQLDIDEVILGNRQVGSGTVQGSVRLELVPNARRLSTRLKSTSSITSHTSTCQDPVSVASQATTNVQASKGVLFDQLGETLLPAAVQVRSCSEITNISTGRRIFGRRIAERRVYEQKAANDEAAREKIRSSVRAEIDERVAKLIAPLTTYYLRYIRLPLLTSGNFPKTVQTRTTTDYVEVALTQANAQQWSLAEPPPLEQPYDLSVRLHESFVDNFSAGLWSGETIRESKLQADLEKLLGQSPEGLKVADPQREWTVSFNEQSPITAKFDDSTLTLSLRATGFTVGEKSYPGMWIKVRYRIEPGKKGFVAKRQGQLEIGPPNFDPNAGDRLGVRQQVLRSLLRKRFTRLFPSEWNADAIELAGRWKKAGDLSVAHLTSDGGWLTIGFRLSSTH